ncbi:PREDICTED: uncharacterized protein LOC104766832 isoform X2 [Camelina sativa]|uniref:Uncharacterized protein LOC104766832 isoform X2 n=1 Tax=Camelina sativa TaxID=90675 RepID=A0ABM0XPU1_CAMSA|nr:PREDICTED: uncharacterized protein LOC104766832 isoform X2 [Camelina sativa]
MVKELTGDYKIKYHANGYDKEPIEIDFTPPFRRIDMMKLICGAQLSGCLQFFLCYRCSSLRIEWLWNLQGLIMLKQKRNLLIATLHAHQIKRTSEYPSCY